MARIDVIVSLDVSEGHNSTHHAFTEPGVTKRGESITVLRLIASTLHWLACMHEKSCEYPPKQGSSGKHPPFAAKHTHSACSNSGHGACEVMVGRTYTGCTTAAPAVPNSPLQTEVRKHTG